MYIVKYGTLHLLRQTLICIIISQFDKPQLRGKVQLPLYFNYAPEINDEKNTA